MRLYKIIAISGMQMKDTLKNMQIIILFFVYPVIAFVISTGMPGQSAMFISVFATMHAVFTPIVTTVTILSEHKEKMILRSLRFANVSSAEYIISNGLFVFLFTLLSSLLFLVIHEIPILIFLFAISLGTITSILLGASIALYAKNVSAANAFAIPIAMVFSFLPMLGTFNETIKEYTFWIFSIQLSDLFETPLVDLQGLIIIFLNMCMTLFLFLAVFHKSKRESD